jgi:hypothetical protein
MAKFRKYDHVERIGHDQVQGIEIGLVHVFPKLDGTNASVWLEDGEVCAGSRSKKLGEGQDNAGFWNWTQYHHDKLFNLLMETVGPDGRLYGEWLVPHTLKTYREDTWRRFWIFDAHIDEYGYLPHDDWASMVSKHGYDVIEPLCTIENPSEDQLHQKVAYNTYLIADNSGIGEGIVLKNYGWKNGYGGQPWAKIVRTEFKEDNQKAFGTPELAGAFQVEAAIAEEYVTPTLVGKCRAKILVDIANENQLVIGPEMLRALEETHRGKIIPRLLQTVFTDVVQEEIYGAIKKYKDPTIDFKKLRQHCIRFTKKHAEDLF